jgi:hypothetical protein
MRHRVATLLTPPPEPENPAPPPPPRDEEEGPGFAPVLLPRFGRRPLAFRGRLLFTAGNRGGGAARVWHEVAVYERSGGAFVLAIRQGAGVEGAPDLAWAEECGNPDAVRECLAAHDPVAHLPSDALPHPSAAEAERRTWRALLATLFGGAHAEPHDTEQETQP